MTALYPPSDRLQPGQIFWNTLDKNTRATSPRRNYVPVVLSLITLADIPQLAHGTPMTQIARQAIGRMIQEAYSQRMLFSRDLGLLTLRDPSTVSALRLTYEKEQHCPLPHTGLLHDIGSGVSHKALILRKIILEKKDPADVARGPTTPKKRWTAISKTTIA